MQGITVSKIQKSITVYHIDDFSIALKKAIKKNLAEICYGEEKTKRNSTLYSYQKTLKNFLERMHKQDARTQKGMIGELLTHVLLIELDKTFKQISPFLNLEEKSIKKGFDIVLVKNKDRSLWITEVKSGNPKKTNSDSKNLNLLGVAKRDLVKRLNSSNQTLWHNAVNGAIISLEKRGNLKTKVLNLLEGFAAEAIEKESDSKAHNVVLVSVLFHKLQDRVQADKVLAFLERLKRKKQFNEVLVFSIQKNTYKKVISFLTTEARS